MNDDPLVNMDVSPEPAAPVTSPDPGAVVVAPASPSSADGAAPAPPPVQQAIQIPDLGPEPTFTGSDPTTSTLAALQRQVELLAAKVGTPSQPQQRQQPKSDPVDDLLDETPSWAKAMQQRVEAVAQAQEAQRKIEEGVYRNSKVQSELAGAQTILTEASQQHQFTKENPEIHGMIMNVLGSQIQQVVERNPFQHGLTKESVQTAYAQMASQFYKAVAAVVGKRSQAAAAQAQVNQQATALTGGTSAPTSTGPKHTGDLLTNEDFWNKEVDIRLNAAIQKAANQ